MAVVDLPSEIQISNRIDGDRNKKRMSVNNSLRSIVEWSQGSSGEKILTPTLNLLKTSKQTILM